jgi:hypothetical protein
MPPITPGYEERLAKARAGARARKELRLAAELAERGWTCTPPDSGPGTIAPPDSYDVRNAVNGAA